MSITVYSDVVLSDLVMGAGVRGKQIRRNSRVTTDSGLSAINIIWTQTLREYEVGFVPMIREAWQDIETLHEITEGGAYGFLMKDPKDQHASATEGVALALTSTTFQLYKRYLHTESGRYKLRKITRLDGDTFELGGGLSGTPDPDTGIITIPSAPDAEDVTWQSDFYVPVHFMDDFIDWQMVAPRSNPEMRFLSGPSVILQEIRE
jgi:uncharacterized protein (TIGR02217 family)